MTVIYITFLTPFVENATGDDRPAAEDAAGATRDAIALVDGTLWPCWSWDGEDKLWAGKYKTTGHGSLIVTNLQGHITFVSEPVTGSQHDQGPGKVDVTVSDWQGSAVGHVAWLSSRCADGRHLPRAGRARQARAPEARDAQREK